MYLGRMNCRTDPSLIVSFVVQLLLLLCSPSSYYPPPSPPTSPEAAVAVVVVPRTDVSLKALCAILVT